MATIGYRQARPLLNEINDRLSSDRATEWTEIFWDAIKCGIEKRFHLPFPAAAIDSFRGMIDSGELLFSRPELARDLDAGAFFASNRPSLRIVLTTPYRLGLKSTTTTFPEIRKAGREAGLWSFDKGTALEFTLMGASLQDTVSVMMDPLELEYMLVVLVIRPPVRPHAIAVQIDSQSASDHARIPTDSMWAFIEAPRTRGNDTDSLSGGGEG